MPNPYIGEIRMGVWNYAPLGWALCDGSLVQISQCEILFNIIGTTYGGDGNVTFGLPDMRSRVPYHQGAGYSIGQRQGAERITLSVDQIPAHTHTVNATTLPAAAPSPVNSTLATQLATFVYHNTGSVKAMAPSMVTNAGGSQPHNNMQPYQCVSFIIALEGVYPPHD